MASEAMVVADSKQKLAGAFKDTAISVVWARQYPGAVEGLLIANEPTRAGPPILGIIGFLAVEAPTLTIIEPPDPIVGASVNIEIQPPVWMVRVVHIDRQAFAPDVGLDDALLVQEPRLINVIGADPSIDAHLQPAHAIYQEFVDRHVFVAAIRDPLQAVTAAKMPPDLICIRASA